MKEIALLFLYLMCFVLNGSALTRLTFLRDQVQPAYRMDHPQIA